MDRFKSVWLFFTKKSEFVATCNTCGKDFSFKTSSSNLRKHWMKIHGRRSNGKPSELSDSDRHNSDNDNSDEEQEKQKKPKATWNYFEVLDSDKFEATCKICQQVVPFTSSSDLAQHVQDQHDEEPKDSDEEFVPDPDDYSPDVEESSTRPRLYKSKLWKYFTPTSNKMAVCLLCKKPFNYRSTISNLRRHLVRKHRGASTPSREESQKVFRMSADGTLYEIETVTGQEEKVNENEDDPMAMNTVYLNEEELDLLDEPVTPTPKKKPKLLSTFTQRPKERVRVSRGVSLDMRTRSEELELPRKQVSMHTPNTMSSLDYFGQYVVSLLKELPKPVSDQLQSVIIKQILTSKMALEPQAVAAKYEIKISQNSENETKIPEPVSFCVIKEANDTAEKVTKLTESVVQE